MDTSSFKTIWEQIEATRHAIKDYENRIEKCRRTDGIGLKGLEEDLAMLRTNLENLEGRAVSNAEYDRLAKRNLP